MLGIVYADPVRAPWKWNEPTKARPAGALPGGLTADDWNRMSSAERDAYLRRYAATENERNALLAEAARQGLTTITEGIRAYAAAETARRQREADLEIARINANRDIELARIRAQQGNAPGSGQLTILGQQGLTSAPHPTTGEEWDALTPEQQLAAGPRPPGLKKWQKWALWAGGGVVVLGGGFALTMKGKRSNPWTSPNCQFEYQRIARSR